MKTCERTGPFAALTLVGLAKDRELRDTGNYPMGVIAVFSRANVSEGAEIWGRIFADHVAGAIANARAFEEIQRLKSQLEQQNAYLQEEVVDAKAFGDLVGQSAELLGIIPTTLISRIKKMGIKRPKLE